MENKEEKKHKDISKIGHRQRLKQRFMEAPLRSLPDYEILEMLLFMAYPRHDTKQIAKNLLNKFGGLTEIINADASQFKNIEGINISVHPLMRLLKDFFTRLYVSKESKNYHVITNWNDVVNYCKMTIGSSNREVVKILFLNKKNQLIADENLHKGTIDKVEIYPREILYRAVSNRATAIIIVHNHPSGDPNPSKNDLIITKQVTFALQSAQITLLDHVIVSDNQHFSFKNNGLL